MKEKQGITIKQKPAVSFEQVIVQNFIRKFSDYYYYYFFYLLELRLPLRYVVSTSRVYCSSQSRIIPETGPQAR